MSKRRIAILAIVVLAVVLLLVINSGSQGDEPASNQPLHHSQVQDELQQQANQVATAVVTLQEANIARQTISQAASEAVNDTKNKIEYAADWCIASIDLNQADYLYYHAQLQGWRIAKGGVSGAMTDQFGNTYLSDASYPLIPYLESDYTDLWSQISKDNEFAMLAALDRSDIDMTSQHKIAQRLVVKGHTAKALTYLVIFELVNAKLVYNKTGEINSDVKSKLSRALVYTAYGIEHFDLSAAFIYLNMLNSVAFPTELNPVHALGDSNNLSTYLQELRQYIDNMRSDLNLFAMTDTDTPKAAKHDFDSTLSRLYLEYGNELNNLKRILPSGAGDMLKMSDCVTRQVEFFSALERKRSSNKELK